MIGQLRLASENTSAETIMFSCDLKTTCVIGVIKSVLLRGRYYSVPANAFLCYVSAFVFVFCNSVLIIAHISKRLWAIGPLS